MFHTPYTHVLCMCMCVLSCTRTQCTYSYCQPYESFLDKRQLGIKKIVSNLRHGHVFIFIYFTLLLARDDFCLQLHL